MRELLIAKVPKNIQIGIFHGDFQWSNLFFSKEGELLAVIDWELVGIGSVLNDIGWFATFMTLWLGMMLIILNIQCRMQRNL